MWAASNSEAELISFACDVLAQQQPASLDQVPSSGIAAKPVSFIDADTADHRAFLANIVANQPKRKEIHVIADNLLAHKTPKVDEFLSERPNVHLHLTPTYWSWLNQVELWCVKIERDVIARGIFTSVTDFNRKLMHSIRLYNKNPRAVKWKYFDPSRRITSDSVHPV